MVVTNGKLFRARTTLADDNLSFPRSQFRGETIGQTNVATHRGR